jgi:bifunctional DNA-binding transcriptional regulator/antitoxin component of YhaV-PrlF toxin-antitoxin module
MIRTKIDRGFTVNIPAPFRSRLSVGEEVVISSDAQGRLIITPVEQIRAQLMETFGMWSDRTDIPREAVEYVDDLRWGNRLDQIASQMNEAD